MQLGHHWLHFYVMIARGRRFAGVMLLLMELLLTIFRVHVNTTQQFLPLLPLDETGQSLDVGLRHVQRLNLGHLLLGGQIRYHLTQPLKRIVQAVHAFPLAGVGRLAALLKNGGGRRPEALLAATLALFGRWPSAVGGRRGGIVAGTQGVGVVIVIIRLVVMVVV